MLFEHIIERKGIPHQMTRPNAEAHLVVCRPFLPERDFEGKVMHFFFAEKSAFDRDGFAQVAEAYSMVYVEQTLEDLFKEYSEPLKTRIRYIPDFVEDRVNQPKKGIALLASNDTHVNFMLPIASALGNVLFLVPDRRNKDEAAIARLEKAGVPYVEVNYHATELPILDDRNVGIVFCGADWTSEFIAVKRCIGARSIVTVALQEGPQDWHMRFRHNGVIKVQNHYRNADVLCAQGAVTLQLIRPKFMVITGNPKIDSFTDKKNNGSPRVFINCNFTYINTKPKYENNREMWLAQAVKACEKLNLPYVISQHPRDDGDIQDPNLIASHADIVADQLKQCSIVISRFSSISYEALALGLESVYFNPHLEPMATFNSEKDGTVPVVFNVGELVKALEKHKIGERTTMEAKRLFLRRHVGPLNGSCLSRITAILNSLSQNIVTGKPQTYTEAKSIPKKTQDPKGTVAIFSKMPATGYSGGRYHAMMKAEGFATAGYRVFMVMDNYPVFFHDFRMLLKHQSIEVVLSRDFQPNFPVDADLDLVICVPGMDKSHLLYYGALEAARRYDAKLALLNFESPDWFNEMSPTPRDESFWMQWDWISRYCDAIVSSTEESTRRARHYYLQVPEDVLFTTCSPSINSVVADVVPIQKKERRIFSPTRFVRGEHKGGLQIPDLITEAWRGFTLVLLVGATPPKDFLEDLDKNARKHGVTYELLSNSSDFEKFTELKRACLTIYPSSFEGYGYPPIESLYCGTPCICFDLPVFRETCGDSVMTVPIGDWKAYRQRIDQHLREYNEGSLGQKSDLFAAVERLARIEHYAERLDRLFNEIHGGDSAFGQKIAALRNAANPLHDEPQSRIHRKYSKIPRAVVELARKLAKPFLNWIR